jgi:hypothetical protein
MGSGSVLRGVVVGVALSVASVAGVDIGSHVRISDGDLRVQTSRSAARSETLRSLLQQLDTTSVLVFVDCDWFLPSGVAGQTTFISALNGLRYVRVAIGCSLPLRQRLPILAHELQHALEIGENPAVTDVESMESYYEGAGFETYPRMPHRWFETDAAINVQRKVEQELDGRSLSDGPIPAAAAGS